MASKGFEGGSKQDLWKLDADLVRVGVNLRHDLGDIETLARSIAAAGQETPGLVRRDSEGYAVVVAGYRRLAAIRMINADPAKYGAKLIGPIPFKAVFKPMTEEEALAANLRENIERRELSPVDRAHAAARLEGFGWERSRIGEVMGVSPGRVAQYLSLLDLPAETVRLVHAGELTEAGARAMLGAPVDDVREASQRIASGEEKPREAVERVKATKREAGAKVGRTLAELKRVLEDEIGSNRALLLLAWISGDPKVTTADLDTIFDDERMALSA